MIESLKSVAFNVVSFQVALLHKTLAVLGLPVAEEERLQSRAGEDTRNKVRQLQLQLRLNVAEDDMQVVNQATVVALGDRLKQMGLTDGKRAFIVSGTVKNRNGTVKARQRLVAFDLDLRGVGVYRTAKTLGEVLVHGGAELLGVTTSDATGQYRLTFYDWQYRRAERGKADVVIFAFDPGDDTRRILGRSALADSSNYSDGIVHDHDVMLYGEGERSEYETVMAALKAFLGENGMAMAEIAGSAEQLAFAAGELDLARDRVEIAARAELLVRKNEKLAHELLYGIGRQNIVLVAAVLQGKSDSELRRAIDASVAANIVRAPSESEIAAFLTALREAAVKVTLEDETNGAAKNSLNKMLSHALPEEAHRVSFVGALGTFDGSDYRTFWSEHLPAQPAFENKPELVQRLLLVSQLTALTGNHQELVGELTARKIQSPVQLLDLDDAAWLEIVKKSGVPEGVPGTDEASRAKTYVARMRATLDAAYPTQRIGRMVKAKELPLAEPVAGGITAFLAGSQQFDFATSRIFDFDKQIHAAAGDHADAVRANLLKLQRVYQVSTDPSAMATLMQKQLHSAYAIANVPRKTFLRTYSDSLGGADAAFAIHERASHIAAKSEVAAMHIWEYAKGKTPDFVMGGAEASAVQAVLQNELPNYATLFGSPDVCECEHCSSVYGAPAYFVELLRFLWRGEPNAASKTPLAILSERRPDLLQLPLTCENSNTVIPYIDLANEVMEYYAANDSVALYAGHDTGDTTTEELRANPQNFNLEAYRKLKDAKYPFTIPYHQPLGVIRTYSDFLKVARYDAMKAVAPEPDATTTQAIAAEALRLSQEEHQVITGKAFDGTADATALHQYWGLAAAGDLESLSAVRELLRRSGMAYTDLVELLKTRFINPYQSALDFLEQLVSYATIDAPTVWARLQQIDAGTLDPATDAALTAALTAYNTARSTTVTPAEFGAWVGEHFDELKKVITLYEPQSKCDLDNTKLRTLESIYSGAATSGVTNNDWSKIHRFVRLWRKLGWSIHETDLMLAALGQDDITDETVVRLEPVLQLQKATRQPLNQLAVMWGDIDFYGTKSLYRKLFLNKAVQQIDDAFAADAWGDYLQDATEILGDHRSAILAAFRLRDEDLDAILGVAQVIDGGVPRLIDPATDILNLSNLSTIYRYAALAKALKMRARDLCKVIDLFGATPFSRWDVQQGKYVDIGPSATAELEELAAATKAAGFKPTTLQYILEGTLPAESTLGLSRAKALRTVRAVRDAFGAIEQAHPDEAPSPLTVDVFGAKLALTFDTEVVARFLGILAGTATFETTTDLNLAVTIPAALAAKYSYTRGSGRLTVTGVVTDAERTALEALPGVNAAFSDAVDELYGEPETFIAANFEGVLSDLNAANATLLDHPAQVTAATLDEKLAYVYVRFVPVLKSKLRRDAITQHMAALIGLSETATAVLIDADVETLIDDLSTAGFSATYFNDATWTNPVVTTTDAIVDFDWAGAAPQPGVPADGFSARWDAFVAAPASGEYTLVVDVAESDEVFRIYLDDALILEKIAADAGTSFEVVTQLNAAQMQRLRVEYGDTSANAALHLAWKTATTALAVIPSTAAYPGAIVDAFVALATLYHRAAKLVLGFALTETELAHFITYAANFDNLDFKALTADDWRRVYDYTSLRKAVPQAQALLTDVFAAANTTTPAATVDDLKALLVQATAWDATNVDYLVDTHFALTPADFKNEIALDRLRALVEITVATGLSGETIAEWGAATTNFDALHETSQVIKNAVKAKYDDADWMELAGNLSDTLREQQQAALVAYLLTRPAIQAWGARDADALFEFFLIDVQMTAGMETSRIVQANASVQMFVNRCLLNLESDRSDGTEKGVAPTAVDKDRWEWMKAYRVWEANRKVFLYPENYLEPDWRMDRSEQFKELESYLVQNDITDRTVETAFRNYLTSLNEMANLEVCGMCREDHDDGKLKYLHVFGRTHNAPYKFYYRTWNEFRKWSAWQKVPVDIRCVENGDDSGVHLMPLMWKNRLFLFWAEIFTKQEQPTTNADQSAEDVSDDNMSTLAALEYWEIKLAWTEYVDGKWTPKQVAKEMVKQFHHWYLPNESALRFATEIGPDKELNISFLIETTQPREWAQTGSYSLPDIASKMSTITDYMGKAHETWDQGYTTKFQNVAVKDDWMQLQLLGETYLREETNHRLMLTPTWENFAPSFDEPFFFSDPVRTYFVRPIDIPIYKYVRDPEVFKPYLPGLIEKSFYAKPRGIGPDDYFPSDRAEVINPVRARSGNGHSTNGGGHATTSAIPMMAMASRPTAGAGMVIDREGPEVMPTANTTVTSLKNTATVARAFGGYVVDNADKIIDWGKGYKHWFHRTGLEFHTFYHPHSSDYVTNLNQGGISRLLESDTEIASDNGTTFVDNYDPKFAYGLVQKPSDFASRTYYKENVCFDVYGANSLYNWELFFHAPLYIATRLCRNGRYEEAMKWFHYIFDPTTDELPLVGQSEVSRYWKVLPFKTTPATSLEDWFRALAPNNNPDAENAIIAEWRDNPFDPHLIASNRPLAYMKHVVIKYVENLLAWGDSLFRQDTMESVNEALQIYVIANHILGPRPEFVPKRGLVKAESYASLEGKWDDFSNALVALENLFPYSSETSVSDSSTGTSLLGVGQSLYFGIPANDKLMEYWDTVADRLFKIRHCQNIDGVERKLALFAPPIDPGALIDAAAKGLSLGSILADLSSPPPIYRFTFLIQRANEFCADVKTLGSQLLAALEKKDAEELMRLRASHETQMLTLITAIKERQVLDAKAHKENLLKSRDTAEFRLQHFADLLGNNVSVPGAPELAATLTADTSIPDTTIATVATDVDESLVDSDEGGIKLIPREKEELDKSHSAMIAHQVASGMEGLGGMLNFIPNFQVSAQPLGIGAVLGYGGSNVGPGVSGLAKVPQIIGNVLLHQGTVAAKAATYIRREQDWTLQANLAAREVVQLDKQIVSAAIRIQIAETELTNHQQAIANAQGIEQHLQSKFTNQELYQWMKEQLFGVYKQAYNLAYDMAKKAEKAYRFELGTELASFIQYGYWESSTQGLVAGEKLQLALRQLEKSYLEENRRELELTKNISLARLDPLALIQLRETGRCFISLPEELFDLDYRGHYFRRIKNVRLSIPCVAGPHTAIACSLHLVSNSLRVNTSMNSEGDYEHENDEGTWIDDDRFRTNRTPVTGIATSQAQNDAGMFELSFRDERYLPFEGAGAISEWQLELSTDKELRQFDYETISDIIVHLSYTAREAGGLFKDKATTYLKDYLVNADDLAHQPLVQMFSLKHDFPTEFYKFLHPSVSGAEQILSFTIGEGRFPFFVRGRDVVLDQIELFARCTQASGYKAVLSYVNHDGDTVTSSELDLPQNATYGGINKVTLGVNDAGLALDELDISGTMTVKLKRGPAADYTALVTTPEDEVVDMYLVLRYRLSNP